MSRHSRRTLTVDKSTFSGNSAVTGGGGIFVDVGAVGLITDSAFYGNRDNICGGGICNFGALTVADSTLAGNTAEVGGGIFNASTLAVDHSTITQNSAFSAGGGIYVCVEGQVPPQPAPQVPCHGTVTLTRTSATENTPDDIFP